MTNEEIINLYIQSIRGNNNLFLEDFIRNTPAIEEHIYEYQIDDLLVPLYHEIYSSDFYNLLIDKSKPYMGGMLVWFQLKPEGARALKKFTNLQDYCDNLEKEQKTGNKNINIGGNITFESGAKVNFLSDNAQIYSSDEALEQLSKMIDLVNQNQKIDALIKAKILDMYENLQLSIETAKKDKLPLVDNLTSIASSMLSIYNTIFPLSIG